MTSNISPILPLSGLPLCVSLIEHHHPSAGIPPENTFLILIYGTTKMLNRPYFVIMEKSRIGSEVLPFE